MNCLETMNTILMIAFLVCYAYQFFYILVPHIKKDKLHKQAKLHRYAVLICARNEEAVIADLIDSLHGQTYPQDKLKIFVMADNCTDRTADAARTACQAPLDMLAHCEQVALLLAAALETASPLLRSDVGCAAALCRAAAEAAAMNVFVNTGLLAPADRAETEARAERLRASIVRRCTRTVNAVRKQLRGEG